MESRSSYSEDYYNILGVTPNADISQIRKAWKKMALLKHPDKGGNEEHMKLLNIAYKTLSNIQKRAEFDDQREDQQFDDEDAKRENMENNVIPLTMGERYSDKYVEKIEIWQKEFKNGLTFQKDSIDPQINLIMKNVFEKNLEMKFVKENKYYCDICNKDFQDKDTHKKQVTQLIDIEIQNNQEYVIIDENLLTNLFGRENIEIYDKEEIYSEEIKEITKIKIEEFKYQLTDEQIRQMKITMTTAEEDKKLVREYFELAFDLQQNNPADAISFSQIEEIRSANQTRNQNLIQFKPKSKSSQENINLYYSIPQIQELIQGEHIQIELLMPLEITSQTTEDKCKFCSLDFTFLRWRHYCRNCLDTICYDCSTYSLIPQRHQFDSQRVCINCKSQIDQLFSLKWLEKAFTLFQEEKYQQCLIAVFISSVQPIVSKKHEENVTELVNKFLQLQKPEHAYFCMNLIKGDENRLFIIFMKLAASEQYQHAQKFVRLILTKNPDYWRKRFIDAFNKIQNNISLMGLAICHMILQNLDINQIEEIICSLILQSNVRMNCFLFIFYLKSISSKTINEWKFNRLSIGFVLIGKNEEMKVCDQSQVEINLIINKLRDIRFIQQITYWMIVSDVSVNAILSEKCIKELDKNEIISRYLQILEECKKPNWNSIQIDNRVINYIIQHQFLKKSGIYFINELLQENKLLKKDINAIKSLLEILKDIIDEQIINDCFIKMEYKNVPLLIEIGTWINKNEFHFKIGLLLMDKSTNQALTCFKLSGKSFKQVGEYLCNQNQYICSIQILSQIKSQEEKLKALYENGKILQKKGNSKEALLFFQAIIQQTDKQSEMYFKILECLVDLRPESLKHLKIMLYDIVQKSNANQIKYSSFIILRKLYLKTENNSIPGMQLILSIDHKLADFQSNIINLNQLSEKQLNDDKEILRLLNSEFLITLIEVSAKQLNFIQLISIVVGNGHSKIEGVQKVIDNFKLNFSDEQFNGISQYGAMLEFLLGLEKYTNKEYILAASHFMNTIITHPDEALIKAIIEFLLVDECQWGLLSQTLKEINNFDCRKLKDFRALCNFVELPANIPLHQNKLQMNVDLRTILKFEKNLLKQSNSHFESSIMYLDMIMCSHGLTSIISCLILSATHSLEGIKIEQDVSICYAYKNLAIELCGIAHFLVQKSLIPGMQVFISKTIIALIIQINVEFESKAAQAGLLQDRGQILINDEQIRIIQTSVQRIINVTPIAFNFTMNFHRCFDMIYIDYISRQLNEIMFDVQTQSKSNVICPPETLYYYKFEGAWKNWFQNSDFNTDRATSMQKLLDDKGWNFQMIEGIMSLPLISRSTEGYLLQERTSLQFYTKNLYSKLNGFEIDTSDGYIRLLLEITPKASYFDWSKNDGLFDMNDITFVLQNGLYGSFFSLDPPDTKYSYHPFQNMVYHPESLTCSSFLGTLLHCDYMLKMLSMGKEASSKPPFNFRPIEQTFLNRLPLDLQNELKPIHSRENSKSFTGQTHRFWLEAEDLEYTKVEKGSKITYYFGEQPMKVNMMPMFLDKDGNLKDIIKDQNDSAEQEFVDAFTKNYDRIGFYFPEFLRLKELAKIQKISHLIQQLYIGHQETLEKIPEIYRVKIRPEVEKHLIYLGQNIEYPLNTQSTNRRHVEDCLKNNGVSRYDVSSDQLSKLEGQVKSQLQEADNKLYNQLKDNISKSFDVPFKDVSSQFNKWISDRNNVDVLLEAVVKTKQKKDEDKLNKFLIGIQKQEIKITLRDDLHLKATVPKSMCTWVPAVFAEEDSYKVYGGVSLFGNLVYKVSREDFQKGPVTIEMSDKQGKPYEKMYDLKVNGEIFGTVKENNRDCAKTPYYYVVKNDSSKYNNVTLHQDGKVHVHYRNPEDPSKYKERYVRFDGDKYPERRQERNEKRWK